MPKLSTSQLFIAVLMSRPTEYKARIVKQFLSIYKIKEARSWGIETDEGMSVYYDRMKGGYLGDVTFWTDGLETPEKNAKICRVAILARDSASRKSSYFEFEV